MLRSVGVIPAPTLESNSMIVLFAHVRTGRWSSIMSANIAETLGLSDEIRLIPVVDPRNLANDRFDRPAARTDHAPGHRLDRGSPPIRERLIDLFYRRMGLLC